MNIEQIIEIIKENAETIILSILAIFNSICNIKNNLQIKNTTQNKKLKLENQIKKIEKIENQSIKKVKNLELKKEQLKSEITNINE